MVYIYRLSWREGTLTRKYPFPIWHEPGQGGQTGNELMGGNIENRQTERIFSSEPFGPFRGVALDVCVEFWRRKRCHDARVEGWGAPSRQPIRCEHNTIKPLATTNFRT